MDTKIPSIDINGYKSPKSRLDTVMGYDQVLVLDQGRLVEKGAKYFPPNIRNILDQDRLVEKGANILFRLISENSTFILYLSLGAPYKLLSSGGIFESMASAAGLRSDRSPSPHVAGL